MTTLRTGIAAFLTLVLAIALAGCSSLDDRAGAGPREVTQELRDAGASAVDFAGSLTGIAGAAVSFTPQAVLDLEVAAGADLVTVLISARKMANYVSPWEQDYGWSVRLNASGAQDISAVVYESVPQAEDDPVHQGRLQNYTDALAMGNLAGIDTVAVDAAGHVTAELLDAARLPEVARWFLEHDFAHPFLQLPAGSVHLDSGQYRVGESLLALITRLETRAAPLSIELLASSGPPSVEGESSPPSNFGVEILVKTKEDAQEVESMLLATTLNYMPGDAAVRGYRIPYGKPVSRGLQPLEREYLSGSLKYSTALPEPGDPALRPPTKDPGPTTELPQHAPACAPPDVVWTAQRSLHTSMGYSGMTLLLSNLTAQPCAVNGYPALRFSDADGDNIPVTLVNNFLENGENEEPLLVVLGPGEQVKSQVQWRTNQVDGYSRLPTFMELEATQGGGFTDPVTLRMTANIIDDSEIRLSPWGLPAISDSGM